MNGDFLASNNYNGRYYKVINLILVDKNREGQELDMVAMHVAHDHVKVRFSGRSKNNGFQPVMAWVYHNGEQFGEFNVCDPLGNIERNDIMNMDVEMPMEITPIKRIN